MGASLGPRRAVVMGLDGADLVLKFVEEGVTPNPRRLRDEAVFARALPVVPTRAPSTEPR